MIACGVPTDRLTHRKPECLSANGGGGVSSPVHSPCRTRQTAGSIVRTAAPYDGDDGNWGRATPLPRPTRTVNFNPGAACVIHLPAQYASLASQRDFERISSV